jgi:transcriptional regulator with XRE-family HTH domain
MKEAERDVVAAVESIELRRKLKGLSMRALSAAAGLRPTSYWGIIRTKKNMAAVKAATLRALEHAVDIG